MIQIPPFLSHEFIQAHPDWIFIYGEAATLIDCGTGSYMGQSSVAGFYSHCWPVSTKWKNCKSDSAAFFHDIDIKRVVARIDSDIDAIPRAGKPVIIFPKLGEGCSRLRQEAPKCYLYLMTELQKLITEPYEINYRL